MNLLSKKNVISFIIASSALFFALATIRIPTKILLCLFPFIFALTFGIMRGKWNLDEEKKMVALPLWGKIYLYSLDLMAIFYLLPRFQTLYPTFTEIEKEYMSFGWGSLAFVVCAIPFIHIPLRRFMEIVTPHVEDFFRRFTQLETIISVGLFVILMGIFVVSITWFHAWAQLSIDHVFNCDPTSYYDLCEVRYLSTFRHPFYFFVFWFFTPIIFALATVFWGLGILWSHSVIYSIVILQIGLWIFAGVMLRRLLLGIVKESCSYAIMLFYLTSFSMIFVFIQERLILTLFTLISFLYVRQFGKKIDSSQYTPIDYITALSAMGTTLTSAIIPLFSFWQNRKSWKDCVTKCGIFLIIGALLWWISSKPQHLAFSLSGCFKWTSITESTQFAREFQELQFLHFMESNVFTPDYQITPYEIANTAPEQVGFAYIFTGIVVSVLCLDSLIFYRKNILVQQMGIWLGLAVGLLGIIGFGTVNNEMSLFVTYFSWAILPLAVLPIYRFLGDKYHQTTAILLVFTVISFASQLQLIWRITTETDFSAQKTSVQEIQEQVMPEIS